MPLSCARGCGEVHVGPVVPSAACRRRSSSFAGVAGFGAVAERAPFALEAMRWGGVAFLTVYGLRSLRAAWTKTEALETDGGASRACARRWRRRSSSPGPIPHVYLDTVGLIGAVAATYGEGRWAFGAGALAASCLFFLVLGYGARVLAPVFARPSAWRVLDGIVGVTMLGLALKLALSGLTLAGGGSARLRIRCGPCPNRTANGTAPSHGRARRRWSASSG
jgi:L-lysine exporter family protein LysE/ArgO